MIWERGTAPFTANHFVWLRFRLETPDGKPVSDSEPYMGMAGHAEIVNSDRSVFAHIHPDGSVAMAALELTQKNSATGNASAKRASGSEREAANERHGHVRHGHVHGLRAPPKFPSPTDSPKPASTASSSK